MQPVMLFGDGGCVSASDFTPTATAPQEAYAFSHAETEATAHHMKTWLCAGELPAPEALEAHLLSMAPQVYED
jgi:hypothetical protein